VARIAQLFDSVEKNSTPASLLLPWLPSPARRLKRESNLQLFILVKSFVEIRRAASASSSDAIDFLLGVGIKPDNIVEVKFLVCVEAIAPETRSVRSGRHSHRMGKHRLNR
jgi:hypothetical protein